MITASNAPRTGPHSARCGSAICIKEKERSGSASTHVRRRTLPFKRCFPICSSRNVNGRRMTDSSRMNEQAGAAVCRCLSQPAVSYRCLSQPAVSYRCLLQPAVSRCCLSLPVAFDCQDRCRYDQNASCDRPYI